MSLRVDPNRLRLGAWGTLHLSLIGMILWLLASPSALQAVPGDVAALSMEPGKVALAQSVTDSSLAQVALEGAVFHRTRKYVRRDEAAERPQLPPPDFRLAGYFAARGKPATVLLKRGGANATERVKVGDNVDGWALVSASSREAILQQGSSQVKVSREGVTTEGTTNPGLTVESAATQTSLSETERNSRGAARKARTYVGD